MENEFLPYELAVEMKSIGFDEPCLGYFASKDAKTIRLALWTHIGYVNANRLDDDLVTAPLYQQAFRWFREKYNLHPSFTRYKSSSINREPYIFTHLYEIQIIDENNDKIFNVGDFNSHEEAELECLKKLIEIIKTP